MKLHQRTMIVQRAACDFNEFTIALVDKYDLTYGEIVGIMADRLGVIGKYMRRSERHPDDPEKRGDEA